MLSACALSSLPSAARFAAQAPTPTGPKVKSAEHLTDARDDSLCPPARLTLRLSPLSPSPSALLRLRRVPVTFVSTTGDRWSISAEVGDTLLQTARKHDIPLVAGCGGGGWPRDNYGDGPMCRTCHVFLDNAHIHRALPPEEDELNILAWIDNKTKKSPLPSDGHLHSHQLDPASASLRSPQPPLPCPALSPLQLPLGLRGGGHSGAERIDRSTAHTSYPQCCAYPPLPWLTSAVCMDVRLMVGDEKWSFRTCYP